MSRKEVITALKKLPLCRTAENWGAQWKMIEVIVEYPNSEEGMENLAALEEFADEHGYRVHDHAVIPYPGMACAYRLLVPTDIYEKAEEQGGTWVFSTGGW